MVDKKKIEFEKKFTDYIFSIENYMFDNLSYKELVLSSDVIYSEIHEKDISKWLKSEIVSKYDKNCQKELIFSSNFVQIYNKTCLKFDLISDFLNKHKKADIVLSDELYKMFLHYKKINDIYTPFKIISSLLFYIKKDQVLKDLIEESLPFLEEIKEYDQTILLTIIAYVRSKYNSKELKNIQKKSIYF